MIEKAPMNVSAQVGKAVLQIVLENATCELWSKCRLHINDDGQIWSKVLPQMSIPILTLTFLAAEIV